MKILFTSFLFLIVAAGANAQSIERKLIGVNGSTLVNGGYQLSYSIGEVAIKTTPYIPNGETYFFASIGFIQPAVATSGMVTASNNWLSVYPNPAANFVRIDLHGFFSQNNSWKLSNMAGQSIKVPASTFINGSMELDLTNLAKGAYTISVTEKNTNKVVTAKIIKQ